MNGISTHPFLPAPWLGNSTLGILSPVDFKAEFGLKVSQVWFEGVLVLKTAECQGFRKGTEGEELLPESPGDRKLGSSPDITTGTIPSESLSLIFPVCDRRDHTTSLTVVTDSFTHSVAFMRISPCESNARSDPRNRKVRRVDTITSSWNLLPSGR